MNGSRVTKTRLTRGAPRIRGCEHVKSGHIAKTESSAQNDPFRSELLRLLHEAVEVVRALAGNTKELDRVK